MNFHPLLKVSRIPGAYWALTEEYPVMRNEETKVKMHLVFMTA
jgi:hypothetical protein